MNMIHFSASFLLLSISVGIVASIPLLLALARRHDEHAKAIFISNLINAWKYDQAMKTTAVPPPPKPKNPGPKLYPLK